MSKNVTHLNIVHFIISVRIIIKTTLFSDLFLRNHARLLISRTYICNSVLYCELRLFYVKKKSCILTMILMQNSLAIYLPYLLKI